MNWAEGSPSATDAYQVLLRSNKAAFVNPLLGFPTIRLDDYRIVTSGSTNTAFSTGEAEEIQMTR